MTIAIDLTSISYHLTGIERYAMCVTDKILDFDKKNNYILIFRNEISSIFADRIDGKRIEARVLYGNNKFLFLQITLATALTRIKADKYVFFAFPAPILFRKKGIINTIHDMGAWDCSEGMTFFGKLYFRYSYRHASRFSEKIVTVSEYSKSRIHDILGFPLEKIEVIYSAVYEGLLKFPILPFSEIEAEYGIPSKYILTLSTLEPRKNIELLIKAYESVADQVKYDLVLVGRRGWKIDNLLQQYKSKQRIHITGFVRDEHLPTIYKNAICFVFPSMYEGFGLPPVEALAMGVPVISSDAASLPEILMDQASFFCTGSCELLRNKLETLENDVFSMAHGLNDYQQANYDFSVSALKVLSLLS